MVFELHVWGPAFTLPSIDPQCLAAVAYVAQAIPHNQWVLIASSDQAISNARELPALRHDTTIIAGYENIVSYLSTQDEGKYDLDAGLSARNRADATAFSSYILAKLLLLLDLSLYVSSENYTESTRPAYTKILPWPSPYTHPPSRRALAKSRTSYLGLSSLDLDTVDEKTSQQKAHESIIPERIRNATGPPMLTSLLKREAGTARFKLDALIEAACDPLSQLLGDKQYFLSEDVPSSLDCLALGYLSLALIPEIPQGWQREGLEKKYPNLCGFVRRGVKEVFGGEVGVNDALNPQPPGNKSDKCRSLPWQAPIPRSVGETAAASAQALVGEYIPFTGDSRIVNAPSPQDSGDPHVASTSLSSLVLPISIVIAAAAAVGTYVFAPGLSGLLSSDENEQRREGMGEAGNMLAGLDFGVPESRGTGAKFET